MNNAQAPQYLTVGNRKQKLQKAQPAADNEDWPQSLKDYVACSFRNCLPGKRPEVEEQLRVLILEANKANTIYKTNWNERNLPSAAGGIRNPKATSSKNTHQQWSTTAKRSKNVGMDAVADTPEERRKREMRKNRFKDTQPTQPATPSFAAEEGEEMDWNGSAIVGTATNLEKPYFRLTSAADPSKVRPLPVLKRAFAALRKKWKENEDYEYVCEQFKSIRQDLTVQRIRNEFTVRVYQTHARIALEKNDLGQFNQCQTQLKFLYSVDQLGGQSEEFTAYRILYYIFARNHSDLNALLSYIHYTKKHGKPTENEMYIQHALNVRSALATGNYGQFFRLYREARSFPIMLDRLMDRFIVRVRVEALKIICKAYKVGAPLTFVANALGFDSVEDEFIKFLEDHGALQLSEDKVNLNTKAALPALIQSGKAS